MLYRPKQYELKVEPPQSSQVETVGLEASFSEAAQYLWDLDYNELTPGEDYIINVQQGKKPYRKEIELTILYSRM